MSITLNAPKQGEYPLAAFHWNKAKKKVTKIYMKSGNGKSTESDAIDNWIKRNDDGDEATYAKIRTAVQDDQMRLMKAENCRHILAPLNSIFHPAPRMRYNQNDYLIVNGKTGCGKSTFIADYCKGYVQCYPERAIFLISSKPHDDTLDCLDCIERIPEEELESFIGKPVETVGKKRSRGAALEESGEEDKKVSDAATVDRFGEALFLFDDVETLEPAKRKLVYDFKKMLCRLGRSFGIDMIFASHVLLAGVETKGDNMENSGVVFFPQSAIRSEYEAYMTRYLKFKQPVIDRILNRRHRWVMVRTNENPMIVLTPTEMWLLQD